MLRFKEFETSAIRISEQNRLAEQMEAYREELEFQHQEKLSKLRHREKEAMEKCSERVKTMENLLADHRARMLKDLEDLKQREERIDKERILNEEVHLKFEFSLFFVFLYLDASIREREACLPSEGIYSANDRSECSS
jgi:hypothetical protein